MPLYTVPTTSPSPKPRRRLGPYSRALRRGVIGSTVDGRSATGRLMRDMERQLVEHVGGKPSVTQRLLIERMVKIKVQLDLLDAKLAGGEWTAHDSRTYGGLLNAFRLTAREIGLAPAAEREPSWQEALEAARAGCRPRGGDAEG